MTISTEHFKCLDSSNESWSLILYGNSSSRQIPISASRTCYVLFIFAKSSDAFLKWTPPFVLALALSEAECLSFCFTSFYKGPLTSVLAHSHMRYSHPKFWNCKCYFIRQKWSPSDELRSSQALFLLAGAGLIIKLYTVLVKGKLCIRREGTF